MLAALGLWFKGVAGEAAKTVLVTWARGLFHRKPTQRSPTLAELLVEGRLLLQQVYMGRDFVADLSASVEEWKRRVVEELRANYGEGLVRQFLAPVVGSPAPVPRGYEATEAERVLYLYLFSRVELLESFLVAVTG
jgi:hypothetical protein